MMDTDPENRPTAAQLLECELFAMADDPTVSVLCYILDIVLYSLHILLGRIYHTPIPAIGKIT